MSKSLASAKQRRAQIKPPDVLPSNTSIQNNLNTQSQPSGLTLPQVIQVIDKRLLNLERFMNETRGSSSNNIEIKQNGEISDSIQNELKEIVDEFDKRYELLAEEIVSIKNIVLSLQSYTMDVNKVLMEERMLLNVNSDENSDNKPLEYIPDNIDS
jgi:predicted P-loop ATPase